jgi:glutamine amidotransferase
MRATILDYGAGNLHSLARALTVLGLEVRVESSTRAALDTQLLVLPGVGAFGRAVDHLEPDREALAEAIRRGLPLIGICLGMQLFFESSEEDDTRRRRGLGLLPGRVTRLRSRRVPHIGWTRLDAPGEPPPGRPGNQSPGRSGMSDEPMYFAHSYACRPKNLAVVSGWATHEEDRFPASIRFGRMAGVQFHPEKSSAAGLALLARLVSQVTT